MFRVTLAIAVLNAVYAVSQQTNGKDETPFLLVSLGRNLLKMNLANLFQERVIKIDDYVRDLDYDYEKELLFYAEYSQSKIKRCSLYEVTVKDEVPLSKAIISNIWIIWFRFCVDWVNDRLYWINDQTSRIEVSNYDGTERTAFVLSDEYRPRAIAVDPSYGWMFWFSWGNVPKIERAGMDGSNRRVLVSTNLYNPSNVALDYIEKRLYWIDGHLHVIESINYDGSDRKKLLYESSLILSPRSLEVFKDYVYWTDSKSKTVNRVDKGTGRIVTKIFWSNDTYFWGLRVVHNRRLQGSVKVCSDRCNPCLPSEICLASPDVSEEGQATPKCVLLNTSRPLTDETTAISSTKIIADRGPYSKDEKNDSLLVSADQLEIHWILSNGSDWRTKVPGVNAFDFVFDEEKIVFSDVQRREINSISLRYGGAVETLIKNVACETSEGLTVDWMHGLLFWIDNEKNSINAYSFNTRSWKRIVTENLTDIRAVEVDPFNKWLFWSTCGPSAKIERSSLDGSDRDVVISGSNLCPSALAVDAEKNVLYFFDLTRAVLEYIHYDGTDRNIILPKGRIGRIHSLDVFRDYLYWTDGSKIYRANKCNAILVTTIDSFNITSATDIHVFHQDKRRSNLDVCRFTQCSHLCLPTRNETRKAICACPEEMHLHEDNFHLCVVKKLDAPNLGVSNVKIHSAATVFAFLVVLVVRRS